MLKTGRQKKQIALQLRHSSDLVALFPCSGRCAHLSIFMINKQIPHSLLLHVWDLQPMRMADLLWLENRIQVLHGDDSFGSLRLGFVSEVENDTLVPYTARQKSPYKIRRQHGKKTAYIAFDEVSEGEVATGEQEYPPQKVLVVFALLPKCWLKLIWCERYTVKYITCTEIHAELCCLEEYNIVNNLRSMFVVGFPQ